MKLTRKSRERELTQKFIETCEYKGKFETEKPIPKVLNSSTEDKTIMKNAISNKANTLIKSIMISLP